MNAPTSIADLRRGPSPEQMKEALTDVVDDLTHGQPVRAGYEHLDTLQAVMNCYDQDEVYDSFCRLLLAYRGVHGRETAIELLADMVDDFSERLSEKLESSTLVQAKAEQLQERERTEDERDAYWARRGM